MKLVRSSVSDTLVYCFQLWFADLCFGKIMLASWWRILVLSLSLSHPEVAAAASTVIHKVYLSPDRNVTLSWLHYCSLVALISFTCCLSWGARSSAMLALVRRPVSVLAACQIKAVRSVFVSHKCHKSRLIHVVYPKYKLFYYGFWGITLLWLSFTV